MRDLEQLFCECLRECNTLNIPYGNILKIEVSSKMNRSLGITYKKPDGFVIRITDSLIKDKVSEMCIKNVIMHEILHTVPGCFNHGKLWKTMASIVNNSPYGYNVKRLAEIEDLDKAVIKDRYKYVLKCKKCKNKIGFTKKNKIVKNYKDYRCKCGGKFKKIKY